MALIKNIPSSTVTEITELGHIQDNSTAAETITINDAHDRIMLISTVSSTTMTISNNQSLTPSDTFGINDLMRISIYENVPANTVFTVQAAQAYYHSVYILTV